MKVEQTIQHVSKALEATDVVGATCNASAVAEFELLFHEIGAITNLLNYLTPNYQYVRHTECHLQHALYTSRGLTVNQNVEKLLNFVQAPQNSCLLAADIPVPLHNIFTKLAVDREVAARLLKCFENGDMSIVHTGRNSLSTRQQKSAQTSQNVTCPSLLIIHKLS